MPEKHHRAISCPSCRQETPIPQKGVEGLLKNFYVGKIRDVLGKLDNDNQQLHKEKDVIEQRLDKKCIKQGKSLKTLKSDHEKDIENLKTKWELQEKRLKRYIFIMTVVLVVCLISHVGLVRNGIYDILVHASVIEDIPQNTTHLTLLLLQTLDIGLEYTAKRLISLFQILADCFENMTLDNTLHLIKMMLITIKPNVIFVFENLEDSVIFFLGGIFSYFHSMFTHDGFGTTDHNPSVSINFELVYDYLHVIWEMVVENIEVCIVLFITIVIPVYILCILVKALSLIPKYESPKKMRISHSRRGKKTLVFHTLEKFQQSGIDNIFNNAFQICTTITSFYKSFGKIMKSKIKS